MTEVFTLKTIKVSGSGKHNLHDKKKIEKIKKRLKKLKIAFCHFQTRAFHLPKVVPLPIAPRPLESKKDKVRESRKVEIVRTAKVEPKCTTL